RKLITMGTPYRGAALALDQLVHESIRAGMNLTEFARSMPSAYQLLPSYACIEQDNGLGYLGELDGVPGLDTERVEDAMLFHRQLEEAEATDVNLDGLRHAITGIEQTTTTTARISRESVVMTDTYQGKNLAGDGTVPAVAGPRGVSLDSAVLKRVGEKHGALQSNKAALDEVVGVIFAEDFV